MGPSRAARHGDTDHDERGSEQPVDHRTDPGPRRKDLAHRARRVVADVEHGGESVLLLPLDPDASCERLRVSLRGATGVDPGVIINDSVGRAWRNGTVGIALGVAGLPGLLDLRGRPDRFGRKLLITQVGVADEVAAAASLLMGQADESCPLVHVRGVPYGRREGSARELLRPRSEDLFR